jgi:hypothetical protein
MAGDPPACGHGQKSNVWRPQGKHARFPFERSITDTPCYHVANTTGEGVNKLAGQRADASVPEGQRRSSAAACASRSRISASSSKKRGACWSGGAAVLWDTGAQWSRLLSGTGRPPQRPAYPSRGMRWPILPAEKSPGSGGAARTDRLLKGPRRTWYTQGSSRSEAAVTLSMAGQQARGVQE